MQLSSHKKEQIVPIHSSLRRSGRVGASLSKRSNWQPASEIAFDSKARYRVLDLGGAEKGRASSPELESASPLTLAIQQQLTHMLQSRVFAQSDKLSRFLRFIVEHVINGDQTCLKEYVIGSEVYDRKPPYHPSQDSIVRTEARRLRSKLKEYYEVEGKEDLVYVYLRPGSYIPVFHSREDLTGNQGPAEPGEILASNSASVRIAILPFTDISENLVSTTYARAIPDELAYTLMRDDRCMVVSQPSVVSGAAQEHGTFAAMSKAGARIAYEGSVRADGANLRVTSRIVDAAGAQLWLKRIDVELTSAASFAIEEEIAVTLSAGFEALFGQSRRLDLTPSENIPSILRLD